MPKRNDDIEFLRAYAILITMGAHINVLYYWGSPVLVAINTYIICLGGVDLFFVISGFVLSSGRV
jgi:peptidoglycan/LPS O-acetylase OafA/YrhL